NLVASTVRHLELIVLDVPGGAARVSPGRTCTPGVGDVRSRSGRRIAETVKIHRRRGTLRVHDARPIAARIRDCVGSGLPLDSAGGVVPEANPYLGHTCGPVVRETVDVARAIHPQDESVRRVVSVVLGEP